MIDKGLKPSRVGRNNVISADDCATANVKQALMKILLLSPKAHYTTISDAAQMFFVK